MKNEKTRYLDQAKLALREGKKNLAAHLYRESKLRGERVERIIGMLTNVKRAVIISVYVYRFSGGIIGLMSLAHFLYIYRSICLFES